MIDSSTTNRLTVLDGLVRDLLNEPPAFDRADVTEVNRKIAAFFERHLRP